MRTTATRAGRRPRCMIAPPWTGCEATRARSWHAPNKLSTPLEEPGMIAADPHPPSRGALMTAISQSVSLDRRGRVAVLTVDNPPVNALSQHVRQGLDEGIRQAVADTAV